MMRRVFRAARLLWVLAGVPALAALHVWADVELITRLVNRVMGWNITDFFQTEWGRTQITLWAVSFCYIVTILAYFPQIREWTAPYTGLRQRRARQAADRLIATAQGIREFLADRTDRRPVGMDQFARREWMDATKDIYRTLHEPEIFRASRLVELIDPNDEGVQQLANLVRVAAMQSTNDQSMLPHILDGLAKTAWTELRRSPKRRRN